MLDNAESELLEYEHQCRICFEKDSLENLIYPCKCSGNSKYIHKKCLNEWRNINHNPQNFYRCEVCKYNYVMSEESIIKKTQMDKFCKLINKYFMSFLIINTIIFFCLSFIFEIIDSNRKLCSELIYFNFNDNNFQQRNITQNEERTFSRSCRISYMFLSALIVNFIYFIYIIVESLVVKNRYLYYKLYYYKWGYMIIDLVFVFAIFITFSPLFSYIALELLFLKGILTHIKIIDDIHKNSLTEFENYEGNENDEIEV